VSIQGIPIYYNKALYRKAGLDPEKPPTTWADLVTSCAALKAKASVSCFSVGNKEGYGIQWFMSAFGSGILTPAEYDAWSAGTRDWTSADVKKIFQLWKQMNDDGLDSAGVNSTALFNDALSNFSAAKSANIVGLMSDVGHWKDFGEFIGNDLGVFKAPVITTGAVPSLGFDGGIGYGVTKWTKDPALAADLVHSLTSTEPLRAFYQDAGAIVSDKTVDTSNSGPVVAQLVAALANGKPTLHGALSSKTQDLMGRLSQELIAGSVTVDDVVSQLAASDKS
jgi:multiple sugar transport system substrate-binding protein